MTTQPPARATEGEDEASDGAVVRVARQVERARRGVTNVRRSLLSPSGLRGTLVECAWVSAHVVMYPLGVAGEHTLDVATRYGLQGLDPLQRSLLASDVEAAGTPIVLIHGIVDNQTVFTLLGRGLRRRGFGRIATFNYSSITADLRGVAVRFGQLVERICEETGYERVHVVGHSMGGLVARYYVQRLGGDARVHTLVTLGTPHEGTNTARLIPHPLVRQLRPASDIVRELAEPAPGCRTRMVAVWSDLDQMITPKRSAAVRHPDLNARNVFVRGVGHMSFPIDGRVVHEICTTLALLDTEGHTLTAAATSITSTSGRTAPAQAPARVPASSRSAKTAQTAQRR